MSETLPVVYLARHGETAWTISHQHTGRTDLPLTPRGEAEATRLGQRLARLTFASVQTSPLRRAVRTCELARFGSMAEIEPDLVEWNYGAYEGRTSAEIHSDGKSMTDRATLVAQPSSHKQYGEHFRAGRVRTHRP